MLECKDARFHVLRRVACANAAIVLGPTSSANSIGRSGMSGETASVSAAVSAVPAPITHLVIRYDIGTHPDLVELHQAVDEVTTGVWFGKTGRKIGLASKLALLNQIEKGLTTACYLVGPRHLDGHRFYKAVLLAVRDTYSDSMAPQIPAYYFEAALIDKINSWFCITRIAPFNLTELARLIVRNTSTPLDVALRTSRTPMLFVIRRE